MKERAWRDDYYPRVTVDLQKLRNNVDRILEMCRKENIQVAGVIKGCTGLPRCAKVFEEAGCDFIASSRLEQIEEAMNYGVDKPFMLIRIPMMSEVDETVRLTDISLNSEVETLKALNEAAKRQKKIHQVILMVDLGDLREGFWDKEELMKAALMVERDLDSLELAGVGTNLGCYGSIGATAEKLDELIADGEKIEKEIGRTLSYISGGGTTSIPRLLDGDMPRRINHLRIGEGIILGRDLQELWGYDMPYLHRDVFLLEGEIIEIKDKPSYPVGEIMFDAFGFRPRYEDRGIRRKALLALGKVDYAFPDMIYPLDKGVRILGASSDHTILDVDEVQRNLKVGDILKFKLCYGTLVYATNSPNVRIFYK